MSKLWYEQQGHISVNIVGDSDYKKEDIYVRKAGYGSKIIFLIPGNNTSGKIFEPILKCFVDQYKEIYTVYTFDYRGSGFSSYNKKVTSLSDFAFDFENAIKILEKTEDDFPTTDVTIVGYSMGFGVALEMVIANPDRYSNIISLAGIGTRGIRVRFTEATKGKHWSKGDWILVDDDKKGIEATKFHHRAWLGQNRTLTIMQQLWDMVVFNDILKYDINSRSITKNAFKFEPNYMNCLFDVLNVKYMPESLYCCHKFNVSALNEINENSDGTKVIITGSNALKSIFTGKNILLIKAKTDYNHWRGDLVIEDKIMTETKLDIENAGGKVTTLLIDSDQGYDHGFPITHPLEVAKTIDSFVQKTLNKDTI